MSTCQRMQRLPEGMDDGTPPMDDLNPGLQALAVRLTRDGSRSRHWDTAMSPSPEPSIVSDDLVSTTPDLTELLTMPLDQFMREGQLLEVRVPWLEVTLWFVPEERDAAALERSGTRRGRVWTATELIRLMAMPDRTQEVVEMITRAKLAVHGDLVEVRPRPGREPR